MPTAVKWSGSALWMRVLRLIKSLAEAAASLTIADRAAIGPLEHAKRGWP